MTRTLIAAAVAAATLAAPAMAAERSFVRDGVTYTYTVSEDHGHRVLEGKASQGGDFRLVLKDGWVNGYAANSRVSFPAPKAKKNATLAQR